LFQLTKNLTTHLSHNLCAVLPKETLHEAHLTALCSVFFVCEIPIRQSYMAALLIFSEI